MVKVTMRTLANRVQRIRSEVISPNKEQDTRKYWVRCGWLWFLGMFYSSVNFLERQSCTILWCKINLHLALDDILLIVLILEPGTRFSSDPIHLTLMSPDDGKSTTTVGLCSMMQT